VLLKRGMAATINDLLLSAEYILAEGNPNVILCERGVRTFDSATRNLFDLTAIPVVQKLSHLPIVADPSHGTGLRDKVTPMARAAVAAGADGVLVEVHPQPDKALSDGAQSLYPEQFAQLVQQLRPIAEAIGRSIAKTPGTAPVTRDGRPARLALLLAARGGLSLTAPFVVRAQAAHPRRSPRTGRRSGGRARTGARRVRDRAHRTRGVHAGDQEPALGAHAAVARHAAAAQAGPHCGDVQRAGGRPHRLRRHVAVGLHPELGAGSGHAPAGRRGWYRCALIWRAPCSKRRARATRWPTLVRARQRTRHAWRALTAKAGRRGPVSRGHTLDRRS
jgi:hypothetical protein